LRENIFYEFCFPRELVIDQGTQFTSNPIDKIMKQHHIRHQKSAPYFSQANGQVEVTNKALENTLTKVISGNNKDQEKRLVEAIWAYNST